MPDAGVPRATLEPLGTKSHTGTQQWQSFEIRMRRRRAERCRLRAEVAIEAGCLDDAQEALDEARRLQPELPDLSVIEQQLADARVQSAAPVDVPRRTGARRLAAVASLALVAGSAAWFATGAPESEPGPTASTVSTPAPALATYNRPADVPAAPDVGVGLVPAATSAAAGVQHPPLDARPLDPETAQATADPQRDPRSETSEPLVTAAPGIVVAPPEPAPAPSTIAAPEAPSLAAESSVPVPAPMTSVPAPGPPPTPAPPPTMAATAAADAPPRAEPSTTLDPAAETKVRAALTRYEAAYSALNAAAARAIWPTVDAGALGRAFDGLESQRISLGDCQVSVATTGQSAHAACAGSATWTPKVGDGTRTEARRWSFDLERSGDRWHIVRATTR